MSNNNLIKIRQERDLTQTSVARLISASVSRVSMYEKHAYPLPERAQKNLDSLFGAGTTKEGDA